MFNLKGENDILRVKECVLEKLYQSARMRFPQDVGVKWNVLISQDKMLDHIIIDFISAVFGKKQERAIIPFSMFKTWKDHFKSKYKDKWWMKRWLKTHPIQYIEHKYNVQKFTYFPELELPLSLKEQNQRIIYNYTEVEKVESNKK